MKSIVPGSRGDKSVGLEMGYDRIPGKTERIRTSPRIKDNKGKKQTQGFSGRNV